MFVLFLSASLLPVFYHPEVGIFTLNHPTFQHPLSPLVTGYLCYHGCYIIIIMNSITVPEYNRKTYASSRIRISVLNSIRAGADVFACLYLLAQQQKCFSVKVGLHLNSNCWLQSSSVAVIFNVLKSLSLLSLSWTSFEM